MSDEMLEDVQLGIMYQLFQMYVILVEDFLFSHYNGKGADEKLSKIADGAERQYKDETVPTWKRAWMKARYDTVSKYLEGDE